MNFTGICIVTESVKKMTEFYETCLHCTVEGDDNFSVINVEGAVFTLFSRVEMDKMTTRKQLKPSNGNVVLEFEVKNVDNEYMRLKRQDVEIIKIPTTQPWGIRSFWFADPDGNIVNFFCKVFENKTEPEN